VNTSGNQGRTSPSAWRFERLTAGIFGAFVLAGLTGTLYRVGLAFGWTAGLDLGNVRHAHSHLMYLGWAVPAIFLAVGRRVVGDEQDDRSRRALTRVTGASLILGLMAYVPFLLYGYGSLQLGSVILPPAVIVSGMNLVAWYGFVIWYGRHRRRHAGLPPGRTMWDLAVVMLVIATVGAWSLSLLKPLGIEGAVWTESLKHLFLDVVSDGWLVLAVIGLALHDSRARPVSPKHWSVVFIGIGVPISFLVGVPADLLPPAVRVCAGAGSVMAAVGLGFQWVLAWRAAASGSPGWQIPLAFLGAKIVAQFVVVVLPGVSWSEMHGLRILYLHVLLLGFVTPGIVLALLRRSGGWTVVLWRGLIVSVILVVASLVALIIPSLAIHPVVWRVAAWLSPGPVFVMGCLGLRALRSGRR